ncbi:MAG: MATE family efflux transporter [Clostridia bacterium]|nr:MATE family efflux transporter [Clostridia bacterium]
MSAKSYEMDMCNGPLGGKIIRFALPLMFSSMLQLLFNAADVIVVGRFAGSEALAAVGSTGSLVNLLLNLFVGMSVGANVVVARALGAKNRHGANNAVHTSILLSLIGGVIIGIIGMVFAKPLLKLMSFPENVIDLSAVYMRVYFAGMPAVLLYNYGSAILRAIGDTKRPLVILLLAGILNVGLNLFFVINLHMSVAGVALATIISQILSAALVLRCLAKGSGIIKFEFKKLKMHKQSFLKILKIGIPAGLQGMVFSFSNIVLQSTINTFESDVMAGNAASGNIEGFIYVAMNSFYQAAITFTGQNMGAGQYKRIPKILKWCYTYCTAISIVLISLTVVFSRQLLEIYTSSEPVIEAGMIRLRYVCGPYVLCGLMEVSLGVLRGMGLSLLPTIVSILGACGLRLLWIAFVFPMFNTINAVYAVYPVSWSVTVAAHVVCIIISYKRLTARQRAIV